MRCRLLPSRSVSLETLSCLWQSVARVSAAAGDWGKINILLRRRSSSSSFTKAGREPMAASCCGLSAARAEAGSNNDSGVSCKQPGRVEKDVGEQVAVPYTRQPKRKRHDVAHDSTRLGLKLQQLDAAAGKAQTGHALLSGESILRYGHRLRYHLAPDLRLTSRGASLAGKRHFNTPSAPSSEQPRWLDFPLPCITAAVSHTSRVVESSALAANHPPCLSSSRFRGLGGLATRLSLRVRLHLKGGNGDLASLQQARPPLFDHNKLYQS